MNKHRLLWFLVAADVLLAFASVGAEAFFGWTLPSALAEYRHTRFSGFEFTTMIHFVVLATTALTAFGAWIGLVTFRPFGRRLFLVSLALGTLSTLIAGPSVTTSVSAMFRVMDELTGGLIVGLVYFSDLAHRFERTAAESARPLAMNVGADHV